MEEKQVTPVFRARAEEVESMFAIYAIQQELVTAEERMGKRIKSIKNGKRDLHMLIKVIHKLCDRLIETFPIEKRASMLANEPYMKYDIRFDRYAKPVETFKGYSMVATKDLNVIARAAHGMNCEFCGNDCNHCEFGKALDSIMIQCRDKHESWADIDLGQDHGHGEQVAVE